MSIFDIIINILENFLLAFLCYILMTKKDNRSKFSVLILAVLLTGLTTICNYINNYGSQLGFLTNLTIYLFALYYSEDSIVYKLTISSFPMFFLDICNIIVLSIFSILKNQPINFLINSQNYYQIVLLSKAVFFSLSFILYLFKKNMKLDYFNKIDNSWWPIIMISLAASSMSNIFFSMLLTGVLDNTSLLLLSVLLAIIIITIILLFRTVQKESLKRLENKLKLELMKHDKETYQENKKLYEDLKTLKHDMKHIYGYMNELIVKKNYDDLETYISKQSTRLFNEIGKEFSKNLIFDMVLKQMEVKSKDQNIKLETNIQIPKEINIDDVDLYIVLSNLIENAIENCDRDNPIIIIEATLKNQFLFLSIKNSVATNVLKENENLCTTKENKKDNGYGITSVKNIIRKYHGKLNQKCDDDFFECIVTFVR